MQKNQNAEAGAIETGVIMNANVYALFNKNLT